MFGRSVGAAVLVAGLVACTADSDGDGISNGEEKDLGLDPDAADSDGDGIDDGDEAAFGSDPLLEDTDNDLLSDGEEQEHGSDPTVEDSDADGYLDYDEVQEGTDPADDASRIYKGNWPYNRNKDELGTDGPTGEPYGVGDKFFRMNLGKDQFRDKFDLYDFGGGGRMVVVDASATWCGPCQATAAWLSEGPANDAYGFEADYGVVREAINDRTVYWVTFMTDNGSQAGGSTVEDVKDWDRQFENPNIPVVTDADFGVLYGINWDKPSGYIYWPAFVVLNEKMRVIYRGGAEDTLDFVKRNL